MYPEYEQTLNQWRAALRQPGFCFASDNVMRTLHELQADRLQRSLAGQS